MCIVCNTTFILVLREYAIERGGASSSLSHLIAVAILEAMDIHTYIYIFKYIAVSKNRIRFLKSVAY